MSGVKWDKIDLSNVMAAWASHKIFMWETRDHAPDVFMSGMWPGVGGVWSHPSPTAWTWLETNRKRKQPLKNPVDKSTVLKKYLYPWKRKACWAALSTSKTETSSLDLLAGNYILTGPKWTVYHILAILFSTPTVLTVQRCLPSCVTFFPLLNKCASNKFYTTSVCGQSSSQRGKQWGPWPTKILSPFLWNSHLFSKDVRLGLIQNQRLHWQ